MAGDLSIQNRWKRRWRDIYGPAAESSYPQLLALVAAYRDLPTARRTARWDQRDVVLITYGDQITREGEFPLQTLGQFLEEHGLTEVINTLHVLPFYPATSDDGFSVVDCRDVDPRLGQWSDIRRLAARQDVMMDLVLNHVSKASAWFRQYLAGDPHFAHFFLEMDPDADLSAVTRPRSLPLLTPFETDRGRRHVWTTFSDDQIDLNFTEPKVLLEILDVLLFYVRQGARFIRLDAVAYLWKEVGTSCIHRPQVHAIVKLMREVLEVLAPHVVLLTETNVPHRENIAYFGSGDESHMVYQFSLPPLLLDALTHHDAQPLRSWMSGLETPPPGATYFNFTASHDGIGLRPLEGLVPPARVDRLVEAVRLRGGRVGTRRGDDGGAVPYELNISYFDALGDLPAGESAVTATHVQRFLASQALMLACRGIPGVYFHSLFGTRNDSRAVESTGIARRINRRRFRREEIEHVLRQPASVPARVLAAYLHLLRVRIEQPAFHPDGTQSVLPTRRSGTIQFLRVSPDRSQQILVAANVTGQHGEVELPGEGALRVTRDLLGAAYPTHDGWTLPPYAVAWLEVDPGHRR